MKLYLADEEKLNSYTLPEKAEESFLFSYTSTLTNIEVFFNIYAKDDRWYIKNNDEFMINESNADTLLENYCHYTVKIKGNPNYLFLYTSDSYNNNYQDISTENINEISLGKAQGNSIVYNDMITDDKQLIISLKEDLYYIEANQESKTKVYLNTRALTEKTILEFGDIIFINNLKFIWMKNYFRLFSQTNRISFSDTLKILDKQMIDNSQYLIYDMKENNESLYKDEDYFFHKPRLSSSYDTEEVTIDSPTQKKSTEDIPFLFTIGTGATMVVSAGVNLYTNFTKYKVGKATQTELIIAIITAVAMVLCSFILPKVIQSYNKKRNKKSDELREKKYTEYLSRKQSELNKIINYQRQSLYDNNPSSKECYEFVTGIKNRLWERELTDPDFLTIRVGLGNTPASIDIKAPEQKFTLDEDQLIANAHALSESSKTLTSVPITVSLTEHFVSSIICSYDKSEEYLNGILTQLLSLHNPKNLKIVLLTSEKNSHKWNYLKLTPHIYADDKSMRYYATTEDEAKNVLKEIENIYNERKDQIKNASNELNEEIEKTNYYKNFAPYYLIITDNHRKYSNIEFLNKMMKFTHNIGFSILLIGDSLKSLPNECKKYTYVTDKASCVFEKDFSKNNQINFTTEIFENLNMNKVARELSSVPIQTLSEIYSLPTMLPFLEMFNVGNIEQLNILNKWASSNPISTLSCPIGVSPSGELFKLDLHEKAHGPHGLIAGSTGSGKSEFIITYLLSLAVCYHPDEVQFVLIDYKGGGLAGAFENKETGVRVPHLSGTITNLDVSEMNRTLVSINSELKRRQAKFNEVRDKLGEGTIDIYKYQKYYREGLITEPIPHLFIVSDEFAELKAQQPEFMDELISTARIGRSLGVHLILATQKPTGVVNDQIWSNSKFKVCLKVQTKQDSMEMLKRPEAASIKETGRFYLQVGYDELFEMGQSAWAGASYVPTDKVVKKVDDAITFIDNTGDIIKTTNNIITTNVVKENYGDQLTNIVRYLYELANKNEIKKQQLWLDSIPSEIHLFDIMRKYNYSPTAYEIDAIIGEYDDPAKQKQGLLKINLTNSGNMLLYGIPGSGKENTITTMITSMCTKHSSDELNIYIIDLGAETLNKFKDFPQVADVVFQDETEKLNSLYTLLYKEIQKRKTLFAEYNGTYINYLKNADKKLPNIIVILHQAETMIENMTTLFDKFTTLFKEGPKFGITFIMTNSLATGIRMKVLQLFPNKLTLKLNDDMDYRMTVDAPKGLIPKNCFGRGLIKQENDTLEFQSAYISKPEEINQKIIDLSKNLKALKMKKAPKIPTLPDFLTVDKLINIGYTLKEVPVGISKNKLNITTYDFTENFSPILTNDLSSNIHFIYGLIELLKQIPNSKIRIIDVLKLYQNVQGVDVYNKDFDTLIKQIKIEILNDEKLKNTNIFIIIGLGAFKNNVPTKTQQHFNDVFEGLKNYKNNKFIIFDDYNSYKSIETEPWFKSNVNTGTGIWLGENATNQYSIRMPNITLEERKITFKQIGYVAKNNVHTIVRYVVDKEFDNEK